MARATQEEVIALLKEFDAWDHYTGVMPADEGIALQVALSEYFGADREQTSAVLGIDIYQYSKFDLPLQRLIPPLFRWLYDESAALCRRHEAFLFQAQEIPGRFIPTGDGGFQIVDTPLHALAFAIFFQMYLSGYNAYYHFPRLRYILGPLTVRYAITVDRLFQLDDNFYGPAVINNARMLSRDSLNRCLVDENTMEWFRQNMATIETLLAITEPRLHALPAFAGYDKEKTGSMFFDARAAALNGSFRQVNAQKIGVITAKASHFDIYNLHVQAAVVRGRREAEEGFPIVVTLGNLNTAGIPA